MQQSVTIVDVGPRDGLQNEPTVLATADKVELIGRLAAAGLRRIEVASFVHPDRVPPMADAEAVCAALPDIPGVSYIGLVLNRRGLDRALTTRVDEVNFVVGATESFNRRNQGAGVDETMRLVEAMTPAAMADGRRTTLTVSVAFGCPFEGNVDAGAVLALAERGAAAGVEEIAFGDTIGVGVPADVTRLTAGVRAIPGMPPVRFHFHDTRNTAIANSMAAIASGVATLDASVGGVGGCPYAPAASGNLATEDLLYVLDRQGIRTDVSAAEVLGAASWLHSLLGESTPSALGKAGLFPVEEAGAD